ncbi:DUF3592 domain-containing protein [Streptomyces sp. SID11385]|uniref:DUF3592 domain-containing protein n=1 Tax=Streptomyces sp. SID11385 TaxID=2706031 RepID=UPI0013C72FC0|nr:DUF3592 domain-containing protein [Streptomyces sp. SID11385]NEA43251.1 hypothetical protein [Streptomyces sp. SID11385]
MIVLVYVPAAAAVAIGLLMMLPRYFLKRHGKPVTGKRGSASAGTGSLDVAIHYADQHGAPRRLTVDFSDIDPAGLGDPVALVYDPGRPGRAMTLREFTAPWWRTVPGFVVLLGAVLALVPSLVLALA